jgi:uncharacterized membrane protein YkvA (DUF1232 family)
MSNTRRIVVAVLIGLGAIVYGLSPIDIIPELFTGPLGFGDDAAVLVGAVIGIWKLLSGREPNAGTATPPAA